MLATDVIERAEKRIGMTLSGKWQLDRVIGVGGMAAVYEATHRNRNRVAIKFLHPELSLDEGTRARFLREGYVANTIRHPGAVQILDDDTTEEGVAFLVMELLQGESVEERVLRKGGFLEPAEALEIVNQLLEVLAAAHDQGVVHRDIKPDNLFLTEGGVLKVLDFGIARLHQGDSRATKVGSFMGTPAFCAPEQARGRWDEVDARTDLFSVGATLFTMLSGAHVHEAETSSEQLALAISASARSLRAVCPGAPDELVELVDMSLAYDKEDRFQTARAMRAQVQRVLAGLPHSSKISNPPPGGLVLRDAADFVVDDKSQLRRTWGGVGLAALLGFGLFAVVRLSSTSESEVVDGAEKEPVGAARPVVSTDSSGSAPPVTAPNVAPPPSAVVVAGSPAAPPSTSGAPGDASSTTKTTADKTPTSPAPAAVSSNPTSSANPTSSSNPSMSSNPTIAPPPTTAKPSGDLFNQRY